jgi:hypothetical protein
MQVEITQVEINQVGTTQVELDKRCLPIEWGRIFDQRRNQVEYLMFADNKERFKSRFGIRQRRNTFWENLVAGKFTKTWIWLVDN